MKKDIFGLCTLCDEELYENKTHRCKLKNVKDNLIHYIKLQENSFNILMKAEKFIKNNYWNIEDKEQIKELLLIIWDSIINREFEIKLKDGDKE